MSIYVCATVDIEHEVILSDESDIAKPAEKETTVYAWGANRYSQLGGISLKEDTVILFDNIVLRLFFDE